MMSPVILIILALVFTIVGFLIGNFFPVLRDQVNVNDQEKAEEQLQKEESETITEKESELPIGADPIDEIIEELKNEDKPVPPALDEIARFSWHKESGDLVVQMGGKIIFPDTELQPKEERDLTLLLADLHEWIGAGIIEENAEEMEEQPGRKNEEKPIEPVRFAPMDAIKSVVAKDVKLPEGPGKTPAAQIDIFLQELLIRDESITQIVTLEDTPTGSMSFVVGESRFEFIDEIPNEDVRKLIRKAILMWEKSKGKV